MIEIISYHEFKGNNTAIVDNEFNKLLENIKSQYPNVEVLSLQCSEDEDEKEITPTIHPNENIEEEELYSKLAEIKIKFNSLKEYIEYCLKYGADLDVLEPSKLKISSKEFGECIGIIINFFKEFCSKYNIAFNVQLNNENEEIDIEKLKKGIYDEDELYELEQDSDLKKFIIVFEGIGKNEEDLIKKIILTLNPEIIVHKITTKKLQLDDKIPVGDNFHGLIKVEMFCSILDIVEIAYKYLPIVISLQNENIELSTLDLQDIGNDIGGAIFELSHGVLERELNALNQMK